jgi:DNA mismatch repair protein MutL
MRGSSLLELKPLGYFVVQHVLQGSQNLRIVNFSKLKREWEQGHIDDQKLMFPFVIELSPEEMVLIHEHAALFDHLGWSLTSLSPKAMQLDGIPHFFTEENIEEHFREIVWHLQEEHELSAHQQAERLLKFQACRSAVMFGDMLTFQEMESLLNQWLKVKNNTACEHGRPAVARITVQEMKKFFQR